MEYSVAKWNMTVAKWNMTVAKWNMTVAKWNILSYSIYFTKNRSITITLIVSF